MESHPFHKDKHTNILTEILTQSVPVASAIHKLAVVVAEALGIEVPNVTQRPTEDAPSQEMPTRSPDQPAGEITNLQAGQQPDTGSASESVEDADKSVDHEDSESEEL